MSGNLKGSWIYWAIEILGVPFIAGSQWNMSDTIPYLSKTKAAADDDPRETKIV